MSEPTTDEMIAWCERFADLFKDAAGQAGSKETVHEALADHDMLRAIAARLRLAGGPEDAAQRAMARHDLERELSFARVYAKSAVDPDVRRGAVGNVARLEAMLAVTPSTGKAEPPPGWQGATCKES